MSDRESKTKFLQVSDQASSSDFRVGQEPAQPGSESAGYITVSWRCILFVERCFSGQSHICSPNPMRKAETEEDPRFAEEEIEIRRDYEWVWPRS